jgi:hypothetical protein
MTLEVGSVQAAYLTVPVERRHSRYARCQLTKSKSEKSTVHSFWLHLAWKVLIA